MNLLVRDASYYDGRFPYFGLPNEIGNFSVGCNRNFCDDSHQLKYLSMPNNMTNLHMDLNIGYNNAIRKDFNKKEKIDMLLKWISLHQEDVRKCFSEPHNAPSIKIDFVCFRGLLTLICATIYESKDDWIICATKFKSVIYLCAFHTEQDINRNENMSEREKLMCSWGYKFEQYMTAESPNSEPNTSFPVNEKEEYCSVMKGKLKDYSILFSAEVDGIDPTCSKGPKRLKHDPHSMACYTELKTSKIIFNERMNHSFCRFKLLKWWLQSFLAGVPQVICGFRDDNGIVRKLQNFKVQDMPKKAHGLWSPSACLNFCSEFFDFVKKCAVKDDPRVVYKFCWKPGTKISCEELDCPNEYQILPDWYIEKITL